MSNIYYIFATKRSLSFCFLRETLLKDEVTTLVYLTHLTNHIKFIEMNRYYRNCNEIPTYNFFKVVEKKDLRYLYLDFDEYNDIKVTDVLSKTWDDIYDEYLELTDDKNSLYYYELIGEINRLRIVQKIVEDITDLLLNNNFSEDFKRMFTLEMKKFGYEIDVNKPFVDEVINIKNRLKRANTKIAIKEVELEELKKKDSDKGLSLAEQEVKMEQALSRNNIDTKTIVIAKWIAMMKEVKLIIEANKKKNG